MKFLFIFIILLLCAFLKFNNNFTELSVHHWLIKDLSFYNFLNNLKIL